MMHEFLTANRAELIARCRDKVAQRAAPGSSARELDHGVSIFLDQLIKTLVMEQTAAPMLSRKVSGPSGGGKPALSEMSDSASRRKVRPPGRSFTSPPATACSTPIPASRSSSMPPCSYRRHSAGVVYAPATITPRSGVPPVRVAI